MCIFHNHLIKLILGILVTATKDKENHYAYNPTTTVLLSEFLKFLVSSFIYIKEYVLCILQLNYNSFS